MKKIISLIITTLSLSVIMSCNSDDIDNMLDNNTECLSYSDFDYAKLKISSMGFDTIAIIDAGDYYVVEEDIIISKDSLFKKQETRQFHATYTVETGQTITLGVNDASLLQAWSHALSQVAYIYTSNTGLTMRFMGHDPNADIVVSKEGIPYSLVCAEGEFPVSANGKPGKHVRINSLFYKDIDTYLSSAAKIFLMMHEIGHNLGLRHTDCAVNGEGASNVGMIQIPGTPNIDDNSYMNSGTCGKSWTKLSEYDAVALRYLFPVMYNTIHFENCEGLPDIQYKKGTEYQLSRTLIPRRNGYVFNGWHHAENVYTPFDYTYKIKTDKTLYARWKEKGEEKIIRAYSGEGMHSYTLEVGGAAVISLSIEICRGLNSWYDLRIHDDTYFLIERINEGREFSMKFLFNEYMYLDSEPYFTYRPADFVLEYGTYKITSSLTTALGPQNGQSYGKHGSINATLTYH